MEGTTLKDIISLVLAIVFLVVRNAKTSEAKEEVKTVVANKGNETQIKVATESECLREEITSVTKSVEKSINVSVAERAAHSAAMEENRALNSVLLFNLKRVVHQVGLEWKDDVTLVPEPLKKE